MTTRYQTQSELVDAFQMTHANRESCRCWPDWMMVSLERDKDMEGAIFPLVHMDPDKELVLRFSGCDVLIHWDSWIVRWPDGDLEVYYPDQFAAKFEPVPHKSAAYTAMTGNHSTADSALAFGMAAHVMRYRTFAGPWTFSRLLSTAGPTVAVPKSELARWNKKIGDLKALAEARQCDLDHLTRTNRQQSAEIECWKRLHSNQANTIKSQREILAADAHWHTQATIIHNQRKELDSIGREANRRDELMDKLREAVFALRGLGWRPGYDAYNKAVCMVAKVLKKTEGC